MIWGNLNQSRDLFPAPIKGILTTGMEGAARWRVNGVRHIAFHGKWSGTFMRVWLGHCHQKCFSVWMSRGDAKALRRGQLKDTTQVHNRYAVTDVLNHTQVMRDKDIREVKVFFEILHQIDYLSLDRNIQSTDRFVGNDQFRPDAQGPGNADPLALTTGELVGIFFQINRL